MAIGDDGPSFFARYIEDLKPPVEKAKGSSPAQKLLDFIQRWNKPTIRVRDIRIYGPGSIRDQEKATAAARVLVKNGWLRPVETRQHNGQKWQVVRRPIAHPTIMTE